MLLLPPLRPLACAAPSSKGSGECSSGAASVAAGQSCTVAGCKRAHGATVGIKSAWAAARALRLLRAPGAAPPGRAAQLACSTAVGAGGCSGPSGARQARRRRRARAHMAVGRPEAAARACSSAAARGSAERKHAETPQKKQRCFFCGKEWVRTWQPWSLRRERGPRVLQQLAAWCAESAPTAIMAAPRTCAACAQPSSFYCTRCATPYCSAACQAAHWPWRTSRTACRRGLWQRLRWAARPCAQ